MKIVGERLVMVKGRKCEIEVKVLGEDNSEFEVSVLVSFKNTT
jgi:hypothetical protein